MKKTFLLALIANTMMISSCTNPANTSKKNEVADSAKSQSATIAQNFNIDTTTLKAGDTFYQCEMNPEILSDKAGSCPTCGMDLSEMKKQ